MFSFRRHEINKHEAWSSELIDARRSMKECLQILQGKKVPKEKTDLLVFQLRFSSTLLFKGLGWPQLYYGQTAAAHFPFFHQFQRESLILF